MAKQGIYNTDIAEINKGIYMDCDPMAQPKGTRRFTLNAVERTVDGKTKVSNEPANTLCGSIPIGFNVLGREYIGDNVSVVILTSTHNGDQIGIIDKTKEYVPVVQTNILGLTIDNQCDIIFRIRRGKERVIYWVDANHLARTFNLDRAHDFYNQNYTLYLKAGGNPDTYIGEKWDINSFNLIKSYNGIPFFSNLDIVESGSILPGSYNFAVQLVDADLNPTAWITTSNTVNVFNDSTINTYSKIRGSKNVTSDSQSFGRANKSIKITFSNFDQSFPYYRVAIIRAANTNGEPDKVLVSDLYSTFDGNFLYSGNDGSLGETSLDSIIIDNEVIYAPKHIAQMENRLILANTKGKSINWCEFQRFASSIKTDLATTEVILNSVDSKPNIKNSDSTFTFRGYMPGEVYSMGIVYIMDDYSLSPVFHIPGKSTYNTTSLMKVYKLQTNYLDSHSCSTDNYWGRDSENRALAGTAIRHHRFPFRSEVNKPIVSSTGTTTNITKYKLKLIISLNPAYTPSPSYPNDGGTPPSSLVIPYIFDYKVLGAGAVNTSSGQLTEDIITEGIEIILYDDTVALETISTTYSELESGSNLATYQPGTNNRFIITENYSSYVASTSYNDDDSEILGLKFSNITKPSDNVIGFYIVRNERLDDDKMIVDNAIIGPTTSFQQYKSFGLLMPKQYYNTNNCGRVGNPNKTLTYDNKSLWFFNPEFEFLNKKLEFDFIHIEGTYTQDGNVQMPTISDTEGSPCNGGNGLPWDESNGSKGLYVQDVQVGTSYNPEVNKKKNKDDDGFDLIIGYRNTNVLFTQINAGLILPTKDKLIYLNAASYQNFSPSTFYNVSTDNKIGMYISDTSYDTNLLTNTDGANRNALFYGALVRNNIACYANFMNRSYYKEHNNPVLFKSLEVINGLEIYNGDVQISATNIISSVFNDIVVADRPKKSSLWKIIVGVVLVAAGIILAIPSVGASLALSATALTTLTGLAISYGVTLAVTGIKFEQFKNMIETEYDKGLRDTVTDGGVYETIRNTVSTGDDTIRWFSDRVSNLYIESSVPVGLRVGLTSGISDFIDAPQPYDETEFRSYLTEKFTVLDRDQGSGRLYKGFAGAEVYDANLDYMRFNKQKVFFHLPVGYDCCSDYKEENPLRRWYSQQSFQEEKVDNYRVFLPNSYSDMEGEHGEITGLYRLGNNLFIHTKESLWEQPANLQERVTGDIVSFIGTGSFFSVPSRKVLDNDMGSGGTEHKWATIKTDMGVFFVSELNNTIYLHTGKLGSINIGLNSYFHENIVSFLDTQLYNTNGVRFGNRNNPYNPNGTGYTSVYDYKYNRLIITKRDYIVVKSEIDNMQIVSSVPTTNDNILRFNTLNNIFYIGKAPVNLDNTNYFENKSLTVSYSLGSKAWTSWHSYLPLGYIGAKDNYISFKDNRLYQHNSTILYTTFFDRTYPFIVEIVVATSPINNTTNEDISIDTDARVWDTIKRQFTNVKDITFNKIMAYNDYQCSGVLDMIIKNIQPNLGSWYEQQVVNTPSKIIISKRKNKWNFNMLRSMKNNGINTIFSRDWEDIKDNFFIDKVLNVSSIDINKDWSTRENFLEKFTIIRLIFDIFNETNLSFNYTISTEQTTDDL